mgnify:CR=1 FL=1
MFVNVFVSFWVCKQFYKKTSQPFSPNQYLRIEKACRILCGFLSDFIFTYLFFNPSPEFIHEESPDQEQCNEHLHGNR